MNQTEACLSQKTNGQAHLYDDSNYAHFSQITESNKHRFPKLAKASPITFTLKVGQSLYIPRGWWHWVKSYGNRSLSINYWFNFAIACQPTSYGGLLNNWTASAKWTNDYLIEIAEKCTPEGIWLWRDQFAYKEYMSMRDFINRYSSLETPKEFAYLITLDDYECSLSANNHRLLDVLSKDIHFPFAEDVDRYGCNFWMNFGGIDTGLHFDDNDGLLCVVDGIKIITLYPPSDSIYLAPYPSAPIKLIPNYRNFMANLYKDIGPMPVDSKIDSSYLLELTLQKAPTLAAYVRTLQDHFGQGRLMYGIKNHQGIIKWEFYFYGIDRYYTACQKRNLLFNTTEYNRDLNLSSYLKFHYGKDIPEAFAKQDMFGSVLYSVDFDEDIAMTKEVSKLNIYKVQTDQIQIPFVMAEYAALLNGDFDINSVQYIARFENLFDGTEVTLVKQCLKMGIEPSDIRNLIVFCDNSPYKCTTVNLVNKCTEIGIYFFGISCQAFINFLIKYHYPPQLTTTALKYQRDISNFQLEVGFHLLKGSSSGIPSRTAFYGLF